MSPKDENHLAHLLTTFQVTALGQGDPIVGINLLAAMACALADLAPEDGTVVTNDGTPVRLGTSLLVTGAASSGRVVDEIAEVCQRQKNLVAHVRSHLGAIDKAQRKLGATIPPTGPDSNGAEQMFSETQQDEMATAYCTPLEAWRQVLTKPPTEQVENLAEKPKLLVSVARPGDLESQLKGLRPGRPLVHLGFNRPADLAAFGELGAALLEGRYTVGNACETIRANIVITDPMGMLGEAAKEPDDRTGWLCHFLWLCDGDAGPDVPDEVAGGKVDSAETVTAAFRDALGTVMALRMNLVRKKPVPLARSAAAEYRWTKFLREMEPRLPGISGAARNLLPSLVFGLSQIRKARPSSAFTFDGVEAFARFLVRRMTNARTTILHTSELARSQSQIEYIYGKLGTGNLDARTIYRGHKRLSAAECDKGLRWLERAGLAEQTDKSWRLVEGARLSFTDSRLPLLEV